MSGTRRMSVARRARIAITMLLVCASTLSAHPVHTTYGELRVAQGAATLWVRAFADDYAAAVARHHRQATPPDSSAPPAQVAQYLAAVVQVLDARGRPVPTRSCGVRRAGAVTWSCLTWAAAPGQTLRNRMLADLHADQVNLVQVHRGRTLLFGGPDPRPRALD